MGAEYQVYLRDTDGTKQFTITDFLSLSYTKVRNRGGNFIMTLDGSHPATSAIQDKWLIEIWRRVPEWNLDWYKDYSGVVRDEKIDRPKKLDVYVSRGCSYLNILAWRYVIWYANTDDRSTFTSEYVETILKTLVDYNITALATTGAGRIRDGALTNFVITTEADGGGGVLLPSLGCAWENLMSILSITADTGGGDFGLVYDEAAHEFEFQWYEGQEGQDLRGIVTFSIPFDNMSSPRYEAKRMSEKTVAIVLGQGKEDQRALEVRTGDNFSAENDIEVVLNASHIKTPGGLQTYGDQKLYVYKAVEAFSFIPEQVAKSAYGLHYSVDGVLGDLVTGVWRNISDDFQIDKVTVSISKAQGGKDVEKLNLGIRKV